MNAIIRSADPVVKEMAKAMDGREYGSEITEHEEKWCRDNGIAVVFGYSDDTVEFRGAINDEYGAWGGCEVAVSPKGVFVNECDDGCENFEKLLELVPHGTVTSTA